MLPEIEGAWAYEPLWRRMKKGCGASWIRTFLITAISHAFSLFPASGPEPDEAGPQTLVGSGGLTSRPSPFEIVIPECPA